jgi:hypothetical protein
MGRRQSCQLKPDSPPWSCPPPQEQPQPHEAEDFPWSCPWSWACSEVQPPAGVQVHEKSGELLAESGALLKESAPVLIKNGARSAARAATRVDTQRPAAEKDDERRGVDMMKSIEGGGATGNRSAVRRKGGKEVPSADEVSDEGVEGSVFSSRFIGGVRRAWGVGSGFR